VGDEDKASKDHETKGNKRRLRGSRSDHLLEIERIRRRIENKGQGGRGFYKWERTNFGVDKGIASKGMWPGRRGNK
jgi:hypothetical protein